MAKGLWERGGGHRYVIVPVDKSAKVMMLPSYLDTDKEFFSWLEGIPTIKN
jgi:hypothetical protein